MKIKHSTITLSNEGVICLTVGLLPGDTPYPLALARIALALGGLAAFDQTSAAQERRDTYEITEDQTAIPPELLAELAGSAWRESAEIDNTRNPCHDTVVVVETPAPTVRRSRAAAPAPEQLELPVEDPAASAPATRRSRAAAPAPTEVTPEQMEEFHKGVASVTTRRSRSAAPAATPEISDLELTKAASEAAEKLGVETVKQIITGFNVAAVNQLAKPPSPQREEFIKKLAEAINAGA